jgi:effector-binding domain-containing protein
MEQIRNRYTFSIKRGAMNPKLESRNAARRMAAMKVASISHNGPSDQFKTTYARLTEWIEKKGYRVSGPPIEVYSKKPEIIDGVTVLYAKVMFPVKKK